MRNLCLFLAVTLAWTVLPSLTMRCSRIDLLVLDGSGLLLHDGTVLAIEGKPLRIGCYCGNHPNTVVEWRRMDYRGFGVSVRPPFGTLGNKTMAIEGGYSNQNAQVLHLESVTKGNAGVYVCHDKTGFMQRTLEILQPGDGLRSFLGGSGPEPSYFLSKLNFLNDTAILAGAMDHLYLLDAELQLQRNLTWVSYSENAKLCKAIIHDRPDYTCRNHIRFYHLVPEVRSSSAAPKSLIVCGTGAFYPNCTIMEDVDKFELDLAHRYIPGYGIILQHPDLTGYQQFRHSYPGDPVLLSAQHRMAYMESYGFAFHDIRVTNRSAGHRIASMNPSVDMADNKIHWMRAPVAFVDGYGENYGDADDSQRFDFFFMFFHENAFEIRVGDSNDRGFQDGQSVVFHSYVKARIACVEESNYKDVTNPGAVDYYYNVVRKVKLVHNSSFTPKSGSTNRIVYGAFTGDRLGPAGSAICIYNATKGHPRENNNGIHDIFKRDYLDVNSPERRTISNLNPFDCSQERPAEKAKSENLIYAMVQQIGDFPLVKLNDVTVISMEVDQTLVRRKNKLVMQDVIFVGTDMGEVRKLFVVPFHENPFYKAETVETLTLEPHSFVHHMELKTPSDMPSLAEKMLFANTNSSLFRLPLHRCSRLTDCTECVSAKDPYCFWSLSQQACVPLPLTHNVNLSDYLQDVDTGDYTTFPQCKGQESPTTCVDTLRDCNEDEYCSVRGLEDFPAPIHFLSKRMKVRQEYVPSFRGNWTVVSRFQHRRGKRSTLLHLCEDNHDQSVALQIVVDPGDKLLSVDYSTSGSSLSKHQMNIPEFDKAYDLNDLNCFALSYQSGYGNFKMYLNGVSDQLTDRRATFGQQGREMRILSLGSGPNQSNKLVGKVASFVYVPTALSETEMKKACLVLEQTPVGGVCRVKPHKH